jgi:hypothetical protein
MVPAMDNALFGILGVIAGSLASVGAQSWLAARGRRTDAIASARIVYSALGDMSASLLGAKQTGTWGAGGPELFQGYFTTWEENRVALASAIGAMDFHLIQVAFISVRQIANARAKAVADDNPDEGVSMVLEDPHIEARIRNIDRARLLAFAAGERWADKVKRRRGYEPTEVDILSPATWD